MNLAQLNVARLKYPFEDPRIADFADNLDRINGLAERSDGFVWRLQDDDGNAVEIRADADPMIIVNMSVWRDAESLERFVWNTVHKQIYRRRGEWFGAMKDQHLVMWWVDEGYQPTVDEGMGRLEHLRARGDSDFAFGWSHLPHVKLWQQARCA
ncbi:DUF3291 domain-containing protein [Mesorhizobium sp. YM1C-6-2]|uniref:DUF3291 domain-containing protein n=1 Tax=Mesorhizobium sp. YM1C-6-2 TaxID=1827501 RepID=UPI000EF1B7E1|nr:DUF3291 domain-containing protein [Mesorhizobium sp. YM1C-6-2]RLP24242.1 DUF3291 domain-containing protein [Mesorhizobium sp. YM1C-6-2]